MRALIRFNGILQLVANWGSIVSIGAIAVVIPLEVFKRYVLNNTSSWSAEFSQYMLVWASMLGGAAGLRKGYQVGITSLMEKLKPPQAKILQSVIYVLMLVFLFIMAFFGVIQTIANLNQTSSSMGISMSLPYAAVPLGFFIMLSITFEQLLTLAGFASGEEAAKCS